MLNEPQYDFLIMPTSTKVPDLGTLDPEIVTEVALNQSKRSPTKPKWHLPPPVHSVSIIFFIDPPLRFWIWILNSSKCDLDCNKTYEVQHALKLASPALPW